MAFRKLGEFIKLVSERNINGQFSEVLGISIDKEFMPSVANIIGTDLTKYYVIRKNRFAFNPMHVGRDERLPISCYKRENPALVSPAYQMFEITDDNINSDYLMLVFKSSEFDRNCWFHTDSSVRGGISWNDFCKMEINVPDIAEQERVVKIYNVINNRIKILNALNKNLEEQINVLYNQLTSLQTLKEVNLAQLCSFQEGYVNPPQEKTEYFNGRVKWLRAVDINESFIINTSRTLTDIGFESAKKSAILFEPYTIAISKSGTIGRLGIIGDYMCGNRAVINIKPKEKILLPFIYSFLKKSYKQLVNSAVGTVQKNLYVSILESLIIKVPDDKDLLNFCEKTFSYMKLMYNYSFESQKLAELRGLLLPKLLS